MVVSSYQYWLLLSKVFILFAVQRYNLFLEMQKILQKILLLILSFICWQPNGYGQNEDKLQKADTDFKEKNYELAFKGYESILHGAKQYSESMLLKMAFIKEKQDDIPSALYYLALHYTKKPDENVLQKITNLAEVHKLKGHKPTDIEYLFYLFHYYQLWIVAGFILVMVAGGILLFKQSQKGNEILFPYILFALLGGTFFYVYNFGQPALRAIVKTNNAMAMQAPSAGAEQVEVIGKGTCVQVLDKKDIWYLVRWDDKKAYIRETNIWLVK